MSIKLKLFALFVIFACILIGCGAPAPVTELELAKSSISRLQEVEAQEFAKVDYQKIQELVTSGETNMVTNKKHKKNKIAKQLLDEAVTKSSNVYAKAAPKFAEHYIDKSRASVKKAKEIKANVAVKEEFEKAKTLFQEAKEYREKKEFQKAGKKAKRAIKIAEKAYAIAEEKKKKSEQAIKEARDKLKELEE